MISINRKRDYYANYDTKYTAEVSHKGLNEYRVLVNRDSRILEHKIHELSSRWETKWQKVKEKERAEENKRRLVQERNEKKQEINDLKEEAVRRTDEAKEDIDAINTILYLTLDIDDTVNWNSLKDYRQFTESKPKSPAKKTISPPRKASPMFQPDIKLLDKLFSKRREKKIAQCESLFQEAMVSYNNSMEYFERAYQEELKQYDQDIKAWKKRKKQLKEEVKAYNDIIDDLKSKYLSCHPDSIVEYCDMVLSNSTYPSEFPQSFEVEYSNENKSLLVDYWLPEPDDMPKVKEVKFIATRKEFKESYLSEVQRKKMYDSAIYQIALRTIHELFEADAADAIDIITFNGWVNSLDLATGKKSSACIISLQSSKPEFLEIDLSMVDPKACFKGLKGVGSSKLHGLSPIKPIIEMDRNDSRLRAHYDVAHTLDDSVNLAMMDWEDFEHLVRELFAKEFSISGGEVHVTQASKDGGVDAIAYDPDPIRGGKIVIQAKRYTNTVGVSAVRDLYGTVMNEGANKGILVTTADYGPDAYNFAKGKPLTLLNGGNLLHLLGKHGYEARINMKEAKENNE